MAKSTKGGKKPAAKSNTKGNGKAKTAAKGGCGSGSSGCTNG